MRPSELWGLNSWIEDLTGLPGEHTWWCYQFDSAIGNFGTNVENKWEERDPRTHKRIYSLDSILNQKKVTSLAEGRRHFSALGPGIQYDPIRKV